MAFADVINAIEAHALAAGAALTNPITDVVIGPPLPTSGRCVRVSWNGQQETAKMGGNDITLGSIMVAEKFAVTAFWTLSTNSSDQYKVTMLEMQSFTAQMWTRLLGDFQLGGTIEVVTVDHPTVDFISVAGAVYGVVAIELVADYTEYSLVA